MSRTCILPVWVYWEYAHAQAPAFKYFFTDKRHYDMAKLWKFFGYFLRMSGMPINSTAHNVIEVEYLDWWLSELSETILVIE